MGAALARADIPGSRLLRLPQLSWLATSAKATGEGVKDFTRTDAHAVNHAMLNARATARERDDRMPSSATAFDRQADDLKVVRDKILARLPEEVHRNYPDYEAPKDLSPAEIEERFGSEESLRDQDKRLRDRK